MTEECTDFCIPPDYHMHGPKRARLAPHPADCQCDLCEKQEQEDKARLARLKKLNPPSAKARRGRRR